MRFNPCSWICAKHGGRLLPCVCCHLHSPPERARKTCVHNTVLSTKSYTYHVCVTNPPPGLPLANMQPPQPSHPNQGPPPKWRSDWPDWLLVVANYITNQCTQPRQPPHCLPHHTVWLEGSGLNSPPRHNIRVVFLCGGLRKLPWRGWVAALGSGRQTLSLGVCFGLWPTLTL